MTKKTSITVWLRPEQHATLKAITEKTGKPLAAVVREGIDLVLRRAARNPIEQQIETVLRLPRAVARQPKRTARRPRGGRR